ncbi:MAG: stage II sporulation protein M, partial [Halocynthiibacter sp.]
MSSSATEPRNTMRSFRFRTEREKGWKELDSLITRAEAAGIASLSYEEAAALASLYRQAMNSLSVARSISMDKALLAYLDALCARAYLVVYAPQESIRGVVVKLFTRGIPQAVRRSSLPLLIGFMTMFMGAVIGYVMFLQNPDWYFSFVSPGLADGRVPGASTEYLRSTLFDHDDRN